MINIAILDDEQYNLRRTRSLVEQNLPNGIEASIFEASSPDELGDLAAHTQIDILITDIVMPDGQPNGIEMVERLFPEQSGTQVIYVSGYLQLAPETYRTPHVYFLLKPIDPNKMRDALARACTAVQKAQPAMLQVKSGYRDRLINIATIRYVESSLHKATIHTWSGDFETYTRLDELQSKLPSNFSRCHRSYLVNLSCIVSLKDTQLTLNDGTIIPVSRRRFQQTRHDLLEYLSSRG